MSFPGNAVGTRDFDGEGGEEVRVRRGEGVGGGDGVGIGERIGRGQVCFH